MERHARPAASSSPRAFSIEGLVRWIMEKAIAIAANAKAGLSRDAVNRRVLHRLSTMSDRELSDIGLTRYDVQDAASLHAGDPTHLLVTRRNERRHARFRRYPF